MHTNTTILIVRDETGPDGTFGRLLLPRRQEALVSVEPPWKDNRADLSCIPPGRYECEINQSPHFGLCPEVLDVPGRSGIRIHAGNWAGDVQWGRHSDSKGCILPGTSRRSMPPRGFPAQPAVLSSRSALETLLRAVCSGGPFTGARFHLEIVDASGAAGFGWQAGQTELEASARTATEVMGVAHGTR